MYFTNVNAFVNHFRGLQSNISVDTIRNNIHSCLRGNVLGWYDVELSPGEGKGLGILPLEEGWYKELIQRFRLPEHVAYCTFWKSTYNMDDVNTGRDPVEWAHSILRHAQAHEDTGTRGQLNIILYSVDEELAWKIPIPTSNTTISKLMKQLDSWYSGWCCEQDYPDSSTTRSESSPISSPSLPPCYSP